MKSKFRVIGLVWLCLVAGNPAAAWEVVQTGTTANLRTLQFVGPDTGYVFGDAGVYLKTIDGGASWTKPPFPAASNLGPMHFVTGRTGWVVAGGDSVYKTTDGGATWTLATTTVGAVMAIRFHDANNGLLIQNLDVAPNYQDSLLVLRTSDGGTSWVRVYQRHNGSQLVNSDLLAEAAIGFSSFTNAWITIGARSNFIVGSPAFTGWLLKSSNGGQTWTDSTSGAWTSVQFVGPESGWLFSGLQGTANGNCGLMCPTTYPVQNRLARTQSGGNTWSDVALNETATLLSAAHFRGMDTGYIVGQNGLIMKTVNGGGEWVRQNPTTSNLHDVFISSPSQAFAVGDNGTMLRVDPRILVNVSPRKNPNSSIKLVNGSLFYELPYVSEVSVRIFDASGKTLWNRRRVEPPGSHALVLPEMPLSTGARFVTLHAGGLRETFRITPR